MNNKQFPNEEQEEIITIKIGQNTREIFRYIIYILLGILFLQNSQVVNFVFLFWDISVSLLILLPIFFLLGYLFNHYNYFSPKKINR